MEETKKAIEEKTLNAWEAYYHTLAHSLKQMEMSIEESTSVPAACTNEWCESVEEVIDELTQAIFTLNTPRWATDGQADNVQKLKKKAQEVYAKYLRIST